MNTVSVSILSAGVVDSARRMNPGTNPDSKLAYGSGLFDPKEAIHPGLVYEIDELAYVQFLCKEGLNSTTLTALTEGQYLDCKAVPPAHGYDGLNYPSMQISVEEGDEQIDAVFQRIVTNVGQVNSVYKAKVRAPSGFRITVTPNTLSFGAKIKRLSFKVKMKGSRLRDKPLVSASLVWDD